MHKLTELNFYIVIPAHNEEAYIESTLSSLVSQSLKPKQLVVINDNSKDSTAEIVKSFADKYDWITLLNIDSSNKHLPGTKIVNAFYKGFETLDNNYDVICKFDADLIFPENYLETLASHFKNNPLIGMASGFCYIKKNDQWILENLTRKDHIRGALKAYRKACFLQIGKLKPSMGWDTVDELLAKFYKWEVLTDVSLHVKHLKPTGKSYNISAKHLQGEAMYKMRYGFVLTMISAIKLAAKKKNFELFTDYITGYQKAKKEKLVFLVTKEQGKFIRKLRWKGIKKRVM